MRVRIAGQILLCLLAASARAGQESIPRGGSCDQPPDFYHGSFRIRTVRVEHPFAFLRYIGGRLATIPYAQLPAQGSVLDLEKVNAGRKAVEAMQFLPSPASPSVRLDVIIPSLENCRDGQLDLVYHIFSTRILPSFSATFESREVERTAPQRSAGLDTQSSLRLAPAFHYDSSNRFQAGGQLKWRVRQHWLSDVTMEGKGSTSSRYLATALAGAHDPAKGPIARTEWRVDYLTTEDPAQNATLRSGQLAARFAATTRPLGKSPAVLRFGATLEGGNQQSNLAAADLPSDTAASSGFASLKMYIGLSANTGRQALAASYGLDLGTPGASASIEYRRHIFDFAYSIWAPVGDHRSLELESRFTAGLIQTPGRIPAALRFFGGNGERDFIAGDSWRIRASPVLRSIPANRLNRTDAGVGAKEFFALNLTGAIPVWRRPLVPRELTGEQDFSDALDFELSNVPNLMAANMVANDAEFKKAVAGLPRLADALSAVETAVNAATVPDSLSPAYKACRGRLVAARIVLKDFKTKQSAELFSLVNSMVDPGRELAKASAACMDDLNGPLKNPEIDVRGEALRQCVGGIKKDFDAVDIAGYEAVAKRRAKPIRRVVDTILYDLNLYAVSPVLIFDVARIGPYRPDTAGGVRYAVGGGIRFSLVSAANLTLGYAFNPDRRPFEGRGALFVSLTIRDLFQ